MIRPIGGYFELEKFGCGGKFPQNGGTLLNTGRNAFEYILASIGNVKRIFIPYFTCEVVLEPLKKLNIEYVFYQINERLEIASDIDLLDDEYILYTNYFGIKDKYITVLAEKYKKQLIVDNAQALYAKRIDGIKTFYSPRKYVGIPDGAVAYIENGINSNSYGIDVSDDRMSHLFIRLEKGAQAGYNEFRNNAHKLIGQPILNMSLKTQGLIEKIDFDTIKKQRRNNFYQLHEALASTNKLKSLLSLKKDGFACPMVYPYWTEDKELKSRLIKEQVFVATYWPNVLNWTHLDMIEFEFANNLIAIPCDQRYGKEDMNRIIELIKS